MSTITTVKRHAFLSPGHNSWTLWTCEGAQTLTNPGASHRALEVLSYVLDYTHAQGWEMQEIYTNQEGTPNLVLLTREEIQREE